MHLIAREKADANARNISDQCPLRHLLYDATRAFIQKLDEYTLADTASSPDGVYFIQVR